MYKIHDVTLDCVAFCVSGPGRSWPSYLMMLFAIILAFEKYCVLLFACLFYFEALWFVSFICGSLTWPPLRDWRVSSARELIILYNSILLYFSLPCSVPRESVSVILNWLWVWWIEIISGISLWSLLFPFPQAVGTVLVRFFFSFFFFSSFYMSFRFPCFLPFPPFRDSKANVSIVNPSTERLESFQWDHDHSEASRMCRKRDGTLRRRS